MKAEQERLAKERADADAAERKAAEERSEAAQAARASKPGKRNGNSAD